MELNFTPHPKVSPVPARTKDMKVLALGMSRTGTMSLYVALNKLGFTTYHMTEACRNSANGSLALWHAAMAAKVTGRGHRFEGHDFDRMLWDYDAVTDAPCILFVDELLAAYPHAKIVLTNRDVEKWLPSMERSFYEILSWRSWSILSFFDTAFLRDYIPLLHLTLTQWGRGNWQDRAALKKSFEAHYAHVRALVPAERVLEFRSEEGWAPLCRFLDVPVPKDEPYPFVNEGGFVAQLHVFMWWDRAITLVKNFIQASTPFIVTLAVGAAGAWWFAQCKDLS